MPERIKKFCVRNGLERASESIGEIVRGIFQGLAETYAKTVEALEDITGKKYNELYHCGRRVSAKAFLCELTAQEISRTNGLCRSGRKLRRWEISWYRLIASAVKYLSPLTKGRILLKNDTGYKKNMLP